jgi:hypothetical protein
MQHAGTLTFLSRSKAHREGHRQDLAARSPFSTAPHFRLASSTSCLSLHRRRCAASARHSRTPRAPVYRTRRSSGGYPRFRECPRERSFINHGAAGGVDQDGRRLHHSRLWLSDVVSGFVGERNVQENHQPGCPTRPADRLRAHTLFTQLAAA